MAKDILIERSEILASFNKEEMTELLNDQIHNLFNEINGIPVDYLKPYYYKYKSMSSMDMDSDLRTELNQKFNQVALVFINKIEEVFRITLDKDWLDSHAKDIPSVALMMYSFFVLELGSNIEDAIHRGILLDADNLYALFEERKNKKDGSTVLYSKTANPKLALLLANIYDVSTQVIEDMTEEEYLSNLPEGYLPGELISKLYKNGYLVGEFMEVIRENFLNSSFLRSMTCFNIEASYRKQTQ